MRLITIWKEDHMTADQYEWLRANEEANAKYNEILYYGLGGDEE